LPLTNATQRVACIALCVTVALGAQAANKSKPKSAAKPPLKLHLDQAYFDGHLVKLHSVPVQPGEKVRVVGPWYLGPKITPPPNDKRPNLYFVNPGSLHHVEGNPEYDHTEVLSAVPDSVSDFDVWWVVVFDPSLTQDFQSEKDLIVATQQTFDPGPDFSFDKIPGVGFLKKIFKINDVEGLKRFRRPNGSLPRLEIIRAGFSIRALAEKEEEKDKPDPGR
jgi:hypothetical protein